MPEIKILKIDNEGRVKSKEKKKEIEQVSSLFRRIV
jgi:hypothetical protein